MQRQLLKSKLHRAVVTGADLHYEGSIAIDPALMEAAGLVEYEKVLVCDIDNGERFETYVIRGTKPGEMLVNGAAARLVQAGDRVIVMAFAWMSEAEIAGFAPRVVPLDADNRPIG